MKRNGGLWFLKEVEAKSLELKKEFGQWTQKMTREMVVFGIMFLKSRRF